MEQIAKQIIIRPIITEKMTYLAEAQRKYAFQVARNANKMDIKKAVESRFDVKVTNVATMGQKGKSKSLTVRSGGKVIRTAGKRSDWKKAIVTLRDGDAIDLLEGETV